MKKYCKECGKILIGKQSKFCSHIHGAIYRIRIRNKENHNKCRCGKNKWKYSKLCRECHFSNNRSQISRSHKFDKEKGWVGRRKRK